MNPKVTVSSLFLIPLVLTSPMHGLAQQVPDEAYDPPVLNRAYATDAGPKVGIDEAHHNAQTMGGGYSPFAKLLRRDGYRVRAFTDKFTPKALQKVDILVIVNALAEQNVDKWSAPTLPAFEKSEIDAVEEWVKNGGSLFLIADHRPWPGAAEKLAERFDVLFHNGFAFPKDTPIRIDMPIRCSLVDHPIVIGRSSRETVPSVLPGLGQAFHLRPGGKARPLIVLEGEWMLRLPVGESSALIRADGMLVAAVANSGKGRVALFGEAAMLTAQLWGPERKPGGMNSPDAKYNAQFLLNTLHWLSGLLPAE